MNNKQYSGKVNVFHTDRLDRYRKIQQEAFDTFRVKNSDYGDAFADYGIIGLMVRMNDKIHRYLTVSDRCIGLNDDMGLRDVFLDVHIYSALALMLMDEKK